MNMKMKTTTTTTTSLPNPMLELEIRVLSCEGLNDLINKAYSSPFCSLLMSNSSNYSIISLTKLPVSHTCKHPEVYSSRVDGEGAGEGRLLRVAVDCGFFSEGHNSWLHLRISRKRRVVGVTEVGWCVIPASDIGPPPPASVRHLSYRLRARDGARVPAVINLSVQLKPASSDDPAIGIPVELNPTVAHAHIKSQS